jgi:acyl-CoA thioesterase-1
MATLALQGRAIGAEAGRTAAEQVEPLTVCTFGDSVLDCAHYNERGVTPGALLVRNDDALFPEFKGRDLQALGPARLLHAALDGSTVDELPAQLRHDLPKARGMALLTVGGNDLLRGLAADTGPGVRAFEDKLKAFLEKLPVRPLFMATVYDPTFGDDRRNFLGVPAKIARANHRRVNEVIAGLAQRHGRLVDLHAHFLLGDPAWFTRTIEPSLQGASEVRRAFLDAVCLACARPSVKRASVR